MDGRSFQRERITDLWSELEPLFIAHHAEAGTDLQPLKMGQEAYAAAEQRGVHRFDTMRMDGKLAGYCSTILNRSYFDGAMEAHEDGIFVLPEHRGWGGGDFQHWIDTMLAADHVVRSYRERPIGDDAQRATRRGPLGYHPHAVLWVRHLTAAVG